MPFLPWHRNYIRFNVTWYVTFLPQQNSRYLKKIHYSFQHNMDWDLKNARWKSIPGIYVYTPWRIFEFQTNLIHKAYLPICVQLGQGKHRIITWGYILTLISHSLHIWNMVYYPFKEPEKAINIFFVTGAHLAIIFEVAGSLFTSLVTRMFEQHRSQHKDLGIVIFVHHSVCM
jgi:hypothetical protein